MIVYGFGFALATLLAVIAGTLVSPARLSRIIIRGVCPLAAMFPVGLYFHFGLTGVWSPIYLLYLTGSIAGSCAVGQLMAWTRAEPGFCRI